MFQVKVGSQNMNIRMNKEVPNEFQSYAFSFIELHKGLFILDKIVNRKCYI